MKKKKKLNLSSKAKTLEKLSKILRSASIVPLIKFSVDDYFRNNKKIIEKIKFNFKKEIIVRSSSSEEDSKLTSNAGRFKSVLNVKSNYDDIKKAINDVIKSYGKNFNRQEVFAQPMLTNVSMSGVIFTSDQDSLAPYYIINYDINRNR